MSLSVDGVWKAGVWATTVWADGVWREGEVELAASSSGSRIEQKLDLDLWRLAYVRHRRRRLLLLTLPASN